MNIFGASLGTDFFDTLYNVFPWFVKCVCVCVCVCVYVCVCMCVLCCVLCVVLCVRLTEVSVSGESSSSLHEACTPALSLSVGEQSP